MAFRLAPRHFLSAAAVIAALLAFNFFVGNIHVAAPFGQLWVLRNSNAVSNVPRACVPPTAMPAGDRCYLVRQRLLTRDKGLQYSFIVSDDRGNTLNVYLPDGGLWSRTRLGSTWYAEPVAPGRVRLTNPRGGDTPVLATVDANWRGRYNVFGLAMSGIALVAAILAIVMFSNARRAAAD